MTPMTDVMRQKYRKLTEPEQYNVREIKRIAAELFDLIEITGPDPRAKAIAKTHVEDAVMWAVKGITG